MWKYSNQQQRNYIFYDITISIATERAYPDRTHASSYCTSSMVMIFCYWQIPRQILLKATRAAAEPQNSSTARTLQHKISKTFLILLMLMLRILSRIESDPDVLLERIGETRSSGEGVKDEGIAAKKSAQKRRCWEGYKSHPSSLAVLGPFFGTLN